jgi:hypothetical protein
MAQDRDDPQHYSQLVERLYQFEREKREIREDDAAEDDDPLSNESDIADRIGRCPAWTASPAAVLSTIHHTAHSLPGVVEKWVYKLRDL